MSSTTRRPRPTAACSTISRLASCSVSPPPPNERTAPDVVEFFDGRTATELRLWDALGADLLCPFHYFAVADGTDLRRVSWSRGRYDEDQLSKLYTGNDARAAVVLTQLRDKVLDPGSMRALGFCVSVAHAEFMARRFERAGISARAVSGSTSAEERAQALLDLRDRRHQRAVRRGSVQRGARPA